MSCAGSRLVAPSRLPVSLPLSTLRGVRTHCPPLTLPSTALIKQPNPHVEDQHGRRKLHLSIQDMSPQWSCPIDCRWTHFHFTYILFPLFLFSVHMTKQRTVSTNLIFQRKRCRLPDKGRSEGLGPFVQSDDLGCAPQGHSSSRGEVMWISQILQKPKSMSPWVLVPQVQLSPAQELQLLFQPPQQIMAIPQVHPAPIHVVIPHWSAAKAHQP